MSLAFGIMPQSLLKMQSLATEVDESGFDSVWIGDMQATHREMWTNLTVLGCNTSEVRIGTGVTNPVTRDPSVTAGAIASLAELTGGRVFLGIGAGDSALQNIGLKAPSIESLEAYVQSVIELLRSGRTMYGERQLTLSWWDGRYDIPIWMAAHGPRSLRLAGRIADGVIIGTGFASSAVDSATTYIEEGAQSVGRSGTDITKWFLSVVNINDDHGAAIDGIASQLAAFGNLLIQGGAYAKSIPKALIEPLETLKMKYDFRAHASPEPGGYNGQLIRELGLVDFLLERFGVVGNAQTCLDRMSNLQSLGVENLWFTRNLTDTSEFLNKWAAEVAPQLGGRAIDG